MTQKVVWAETSLECVLDYFAKAYSVEGRLAAYEAYVDPRTGRVAFKLYLDVEKAP